MDTETWKVIPGHPNYQASSLGRIRSRSRKGRYVDQPEYSLTWHTLKPRSRGYGRKEYPKVRLGRVPNEYIHRLVCLTFHGPPPVGRPNVHHKDADGTNNLADNLEWCSQSFNLFSRGKAGQLEAEYYEARGEPTPEQLAAYEQNIAAIQGASDGTHSEDPARVHGTVHPGA